MATGVIKVRVQHVYGTEVIYPVCESAKAFAAIAGTKTLRTGDLKIMTERLGYRVELQQHVSRELARAFCERCEDIQPTIDAGETCGVCKLVL